MNDEQRPFRNLPRGVALDGYSENGKIYIDGATEGIPYEYRVISGRGFLILTFGGRPEWLEREN
jgi:hypothetical protein